MTTLCLAQVPDPISNLRCRLTNAGHCCLTPSTKKDMERFPRFIIEKTLPSFAGFAGRSKLSKQGGLDPKRSHHLECVHMSVRAQQGVVLARSLNVNPHYDMETSGVTDFLATARKRGLRVHHYRSDKSYIGKDHRDFQVINSDTPKFTDEVEILMGQLGFDELAHEIINEQHPVNAARNTSQVHKGFTSNVCTETSTEGFARPIFHSNCSAEWKRRNKTMTKIAEYVHDGIRGSSPPIYGDEERNSRFASSDKAFGDIECRIETLTGALQSELHPLFIHCDTNNDGSPRGCAHNYDYVIIAWWCFTFDGIVYRVTILGYSRRSVVDYLDNRQELTQFAEDYFFPWFYSLPEHRKVIERGLFMESYGDAVKDADGNLVRKPHINKCLHYAGYGDMLLEVSNAIIRSALLGVCRQFFPTINDTLFCFVFRL
jgi:hypothetical protein